MGAPFGVLPNYILRPEEKAPLTLQMEIVVVGTGLLVRCTTNAWRHVDAQIIHNLEELGGVAAAAFAVRRLRAANKPAKGKV